MSEITDDTETGTITLDAVCDNPRADINRDGLVDGDDQILLGAAYGSSPGDANWNPDADINQDGIVDSTDLAILGANMGCTFERPAHGSTLWLWLGAILVALYLYLRG